MTEVKEKAVTTKSKKKKAKTVDKPKPAATPKEELKDTSSNLPDKIASRKIVAKEVNTKENTRVELNTIQATSQQVYVDDIHHANPTALQTIYWIIMPDTRHVVLRVTKEQYEEIVKKKPNMNHLVSFVDCSVYPTLTYGSWKLDEIQGGFPDNEQLKEQEARFKRNPTMFHNRPVKIELYEEEPTDDIKEEEFDFEDEEFDFDFGEDD